MHKTVLNFYLLRTGFFDLSKRKKGYVAVVRFAFLMNFLFSSVLSFSQSSSIMYPDFYSAYQVNMPIANISYIPDGVRADFNAAYRFQTGPFKQISTLTFSGGKIFRKDNESAHAIRVLISNEKQGPYISTPRGYLNYVYEIPLSEELKVSAGLAIGAIEKYYSGTVASGNTNTFLPDASAGLTLKWRRLSLATTGQQLFNSKTKSLVSDLEFRRFYQFYGYQTVELGIDFELRFNGTYRLLPEYKDDWVVGTCLYIKERVGLGAIGRSNYEASLYIEVIVDSGNDRLKLLFNYNSAALSPYPYTKSSMEMGIGYGLY